MPKMISPEQEARQLEAVGELHSMLAGRKLSEVSGFEVVAFMKNNARLGYKNMLRAPGGLFDMMTASTSKITTPEAEDND